MLLASDDYFDDKFLIAVRSELDISSSSSDSSIFHLSTLNFVSILIWLVCSDPFHCYL